MKKKQLIWHIYPYYVLMSLVAMTAVAFSAVKITQAFHYEQTEDRLVSAARMVLEQLAYHQGGLAAPDIDEMCDTLGRASGYRITIIRMPSGIVAGDSEKDPSTMDNHGERAEVLDAIKSGLGVSERYSDTLREEMMYVAVPVIEEGAPVGVVRVSLSLVSVDNAMNMVWGQIMMAALIVSVLAVAATALMARRISVPLDRMRRAARRYGLEGSYERLPSSRIAELDVLAGTLNIMADQLNERINRIIEQGEEQSALLACMVESVVAVDISNNIIRLNHAAEEMFGVSAENAVGRTIMEVARNIDLLELVEETLSSDKSVEKEIFLANTNIYLQGHGSVLHGRDGEKIGAVIVLHDVTRLRNMERMRRDFVANVSHELKTPITSILGYAETLSAGAGDNAEDRKRFLAVIEKQAERLKSIVEDLLSLSEIEDGVQNGQIELAERSIGSILQSAGSLCAGPSARKNIDIAINCDDDLKAPVNGALLEQAVSNLVGNAVRYSEEGSHVVVSAEQDGKEIVIRVKDEGPGIDSKHISRLFERFYRVDKGRSRKLGGTGLGLAIVKHVALAHGGRVDVESELGQGSVFSIIIPAG